ncbi:MAG: M20 family metallopeptidase [Actinobacteria bacterium]|nr:M20 family metallopeptidase [Actinomycetota bacterium]
MDIKLKQKIVDEINSIEPLAREVAGYIFDNPEVSGYEFLSCKYLCSILKKSGFTVQAGAGGLETAFKAQYRFKKPGPSIGFIAEYDALPIVGHACHHHIIAAASTATAVALSSLNDELCGSVSVIGTPAEELMSTKKILIDRGVFDDIDIALMVHGGPRNRAKIYMMALYGVEFVFSGKAAHAAAAPQEGINALDSVILLFNSINALRQQLKDDIRIHGIINNGGDAINIIPEKASARFYIRAKTIKELDEVLHKVINCANGAALQTGATVKTDIFEGPCKDFLANEALLNEYTANFKALGGKIEDGPLLLGSSDAGNLSHFMPVLHPMIQTADKNSVLHSREFAEYGKTELAYNSMLLAMKSLALTASRALLDSNFLLSVKKEFKDAIAFM